eukprot:SAG22_NODE_595_length_8730_cov_4.200672_6_plen_90_part_00
MMHGVLPWREQRSLSGKAFSLAFLNVGSAAATGTCDAACFAQAGITADMLPLKVEDLWGGKALPALAKLEMTAPGLAAAGGIEMYKLSK